MDYTTLKYEEILALTDEQMKELYAIDKRLYNKYYSKRSYVKNKGEYKARARLYVEQNREKRNEYLREWNSNNRRKASEYARKWRNANEQNKTLVNRNSTEYRQRNSEKSAKWCSNYRLSNPLRYMVMRAKSRAKKKGWDFDLNWKELNAPTHCPILGLELNYANLSGQAVDETATIDRIDSTKGYIKSNVKIISYKANNLKNSNTVETLELIKKYIENAK